MKLCNFPFSYSCRINFLCFNISPIPFSLFFSLLFPSLTSPFLPTSFFLSVFAFLSTPNFLSVPISYYIFSDLYSPFFFFCLFFRSLFLALPFLFPPSFLPSSLLSNCSVLTCSWTNAFRSKNSLPCVGVPIHVAGEHWSLSVGRSLAWYHITLFFF